MAVAMPAAENLQVEERVHRSLLALNEKIAEMEAMKRTVDQEVLGLQAQLNETSMFLAAYDAKMPRKSNESVVQRRHRRKVRKAMTITIAVTLTTIPIAICAKNGTISKKIFPWSLGVGLGSMACSFYLLQDILDNFKEYRARPKVRQPWEDNLAGVAIPEVHIDPGTPQKDGNLEVNSRIQTTGRLSATCLKSKPELNDQEMNRRRLKTA